MSLDRTNPLYSKDDRDPQRPGTAAFGSTGGDAAAPWGPAPATGPCELKVTVEIGDKRADVRSFAPGEILVGRRPRNDITIDGEGLKVVSGYHMRLAFEGGRWCVEDKESTNGTFLNGARVTTLQGVREGDIVELGRPRKVGSYRSVRLKLSLIGVDSSKATGPAETDPAQVTKTSPSSANDRTYVSQTIEAAGIPATSPPVPAEFGENTTPSFEGEFDPLEQTKLPDDLMQTSPGPAPASAPARSEPPPQASDKVPAVRPAKLRELIEKIQDKSRRYGEVSYRLDAYVEDLASAAVERHVRLGVADVPGGAAVIELIAKQEQLGATLSTLESELPRLRARLEEELAPLEQVASAKKASSDTAGSRFDSAAQRKSESQAALEALLARMTASLRTTLRPVMDGVSEDGTTGESMGKPVWKLWRDSLQSGVTEIEALEAELESAGDEDAKAATAATAIEAESVAAMEAWKLARAAADERRASIEADVAAKELTLSESTAQLENVRSAMGTKAKDFILGVLAGPEDVAGPLGSLASMKDAQRLFREADQLRIELAELEDVAL